MFSPTKVPLNIIVGTANVGDSTRATYASFDTPEQVKAFLDLCYDRGYRCLDTARGYSPGAPGSSELRLGNAHASDRFVIDTKVWSQKPGSHSAAGIAASVQEQLEALQVPKVHIEYLHMPDRSVPFAETLGALDREYRAGKFEKLGISNYAPEEVREIVAICDEHGFVRPSVYQGNYNVITRAFESNLFPILREFGISFYAYSPAAAGVFNDKQRKDRPGSRFDSSNLVGSVYAKLYRKPHLDAVAEEVLALAAKHGISGHAAALRWAVYHSALSAEHGDSIIVGGSSTAQVESNFDAVEAGPLPQDLADLMSSIYENLDEEDKKPAFF